MFFYSFIGILLTPFFLIRLWFKSKKNPQYGQRISERLGFYSNETQTKYDIWIHAVSLGEVVAITPLIEQLLNANWQVLVTTTTPTGSNQLLQRFSNTVGHCYLPFDIPFAVNRFYKQFSFRVGVIVETEIWPLIVARTNYNRIPLLLINARLSEASCKQYRWISRFLKRTLNQFDALLVQSQYDGERFISLGAHPDKVQLIGNLKFDQTIPVINQAANNNLKQLWGDKRVIVIAGSTHDDEEHQLLKIFRRLQQRIPTLLMLLAPRHLERFKDVIILSQSMGFNTGYQSDRNTLSSQNEVVIIDSLGQLSQFYSLSDFVFVGGSLVAIGGHNVLEPIALKKPVFIGPFYKNSQKIIEELILGKAINIITSADELIAAIDYLHLHPQKKRDQVQRAFKNLLANQGALNRYKEKIELFLNA